MILDSTAQRDSLLALIRNASVNGILEQAEKVVDILRALRLSIVSAQIAVPKVDPPSEGKKLARVIPINK